MKVLVGVTYYPEHKKTYSGVFFHTRNQYYKDQNIDVTVVKYLGEKDYDIDGIEVITVQTYLKRAKEWNLIICHAPDRQAYIFLKKYSKNFDRIIFFIHGNEILKRKLYYHNEYPYVDNGSFINKITQNIRDNIKIITWRKAFKSLLFKSEWVFVSNWMYKEFQRNIQLDESLIRERSYIIYNCMGDLFEKEQYDFLSSKKYDCVTIRGNLDSSKYAIDVVVEIAKKNPEKTFLVIGKGKYFDYYDKPSNLTFLHDNLNHSEIIKVLSEARIALMPTRHDAQGVMMCEMATFGIPVITSDIDVCHEVLGDFNNVFYVSNEHPDISIDDVENSIVPTRDKVDRYYKKNTCKKEIDLILQR